MKMRSFLRHSLGKFLGFGAPEVQLLLSSWPLACGGDGAGGGATVAADRSLEARYMVSTPAPDPGRLRKARCGVKGP